MAIMPMTSHRCVLSMFTENYSKLFFMREYSVKYQRKASTYTERSTHSVYK